MLEDRRVLKVHLLSCIRRAVYKVMMIEGEGDVEVGRHNAAVQIRGPPLQGCTLMPAPNAML
jgi:hypothetical protein